MSIRDAFSRMASSVCIVTYEQSRAVHGTTLTSVIPLSLDPALMGFALSKFGGTLGHLVTGTRFGLTVLADDQHALAARCAVPRRGPLEDDLVVRDGEGTPVVRGGVASFRLAVADRADAGDHVFVVARIESARQDSGLPLLYVDRRYARLALPRSTPSPTPPQGGGRSTSSAACSSSSCRHRWASA